QSWRRLYITVRDFAGGRSRLKDWRRVATRYDRCPKVFLSAIALAALVIYWL
ncbi:MAG: IS5/IS1182 family transposase, partial [Pseudooceanicola atlanticus]